MNGEELFGVMVRTLGISFLSSALYQSIGLFSPATGYGALDYLPGVSAVGVLGLVFFLAADIVVFIAYRRKTKRVET